MAATYPPEIAFGSVSTVASSLYVGDLHPNDTESVLYDAFSEFESLTSVRLCKDVVTGRSLCYGYVNFLSRHDANVAIEKKNNSMLNGKMIRVMWSVREPDARKNEAGNVFVKNLPEKVDNVGLEELFKKFGDVVSCKVACEEDGKSRGYGFVQFEKQEDANAAIESMNGSVVADKEIYVGKFVRKTERASPVEVAYTNLYMKNLDADVSEELLKEKFSEFGKIVSLAIAKDENGACKGFGFVNFYNAEDAKRATEALNGKQFGTKSLYVGRAQKKAEREKLLKEQFEKKRTEQKTTAKVSNLYVKNIDVDVTEEQLRQHFSQCGTITSAKIMCDEKGMSKGFGFVCFSTPEEAIHAVNTFQGHMFHRKPLYVAIAQKKEDRKMQLQVHFGKRVEAGGSNSSAPVIPLTYPPFYYPKPQPGMVYQPPNLIPTWKSTNLINSAKPTFQAVTYPPARPYQQNKSGILNGNAISYVPQGHQSTQMLPLSRDFANQQQNNKSYGRGKDMRKGYRRGQSETFSTRGTLEIQKQMLGEQLYPLVQKLEPQLASKITGMIVEMDKSELLLLLKSPQHLAAKVDEALEVLKSSKTIVSAQNTLRSESSIAV